MDDGRWIRRSATLDDKLYKEAEGLDQCDDLGFVRGLINYLDLVRSFAPGTFRVPFVRLCSFCFRIVLLDSVESYGPSSPKKGIFC